MRDRNDRIRELAFFLWEEEGRPDGQEKRHWRAAQAIIEEEDAAAEERNIVEGEPPGDGLAEDGPCL